MRFSVQSKLFLTFVNVIFCLPIFAEEIILKNLTITEKHSATQTTPLESLLPMLLGLVGILLIIFLLAFLLNKVTGLNLVSNNIKIIESQNLGPKEKLVIVEIQQQQYVLGVTSHSINQICELKNKIEKKPTTIPFDKIMKQFLSPENKTVLADTNLSKNKTLTEKTRSL